MSRLAILICIIISICCTSVQAAKSTFFRPKAGIGVILLKKDIAKKSSNESLYIYKELGFNRLFDVYQDNLNRFTAIFPDDSRTISFLVTAKKGGWYKVIYDAAGREGWLEIENRAQFLPHSEWLRLNILHLLSGLPKKHYFLYRSNSLKSPQIPINPKNSFKVLKVDGSWCEVMIESSKIGWILWRDDEERIAVGVVQTAESKKE